MPQRHHPTASILARLDGIGVRGSFLVSPAGEAHTPRERTDPVVPNGAIGIKLPAAMRANAQAIEILDMLVNVVAGCCYWGKQFHYRRAVQ